MGKEDYTVPPWGAFGRDAILGLVAGGSNVIAKGMNRFHVDGLVKFQQAVLQREAGTPLFTVSNHTSTIDDPVLLSALLPWSFFLTESQHNRVRWSLCAREMCYKSKLISYIFQNGKTLPIERGLGLDQPIMRAAAERASQGDWIHVFPEAKIGYTGQLAPLKWGIGKLVCDAYREDQPIERQPLILPFYHSGMGRVLPKGTVIPRFGNEVHVTVGDSIYIRDVLPQCKCPGPEQKKAWEEITKRVATALTELEQNSPPNWDQKLDKTSTERRKPPPVQPE